MNKIISFLVRPGAWLALLVLLSACSDGGGGSGSTQPRAVALNSPARLADVDAATLLVTEYATGAFYRLDKATLRAQQSLSLTGRATGIALANDRFFVGNRSTRSVDVLDDRGRFLYQLGRGPGEFSSVNDLAVDTSVAGGIVYVLDTKAAEIRLFDVDGDYTGERIGAGVMKRPTALTLDSETGNLLVSDFGDPATGVPPSIWIFDPSGMLSDVIVGGKTTFSTPQGLWVDSGHVFVADALAGEIQMFRIADKVRVKVLGQLGSGDGELHYPLDVVVDADTKDVFVADNRNGRITVFRAGGMAP